MNSNPRLMLIEHQGAISNVNHKEVVLKNVGPLRARKLTKKEVR
jgi:hypothetical protein